MNRVTEGTTGRRPSNTLVGIFATDKDAREAVKELHKAGFKTTWAAKTTTADARTGEPLVEGEGLGRFMGDRRGLHEALVERGVAEDQARRIDGEVAAGNVVVTVYGEDNPQAANEILAQRGSVVAPSGTPNAVQQASRDPRTGVDRDDRDRDRDRDDRDALRDRPVASTVRGDVDASADEYEYETETFYERRPLL